MAKTKKIKYKYELAEVKLKSANSYLRKAFKTICEINNHVQCICELRDKDEMIDGSSFQIYERNYIINLASRLSSKRKTKEYINGEVAKMLHLTQDAQKWNIPDKRYLQKYVEIKKEIDKKYVGEEQIHVFPDFLIHDSNSFIPEKMNRETQHLIMEAKTTKITNTKKKYFWLDFLKLNFYIEKLKFDNAVYFILGTPLSFINTYVQTYMDKMVLTCGDEINRLFFIVQETLKSTPKLYQIKKFKA